MMAERMNPVTLTIGSELELARLAIDLGAERTGGPLSDSEKELIAEVKQLPASAEELVEAARTRILGGDDPLGDVFCVLRSPRGRRDQGQFFTPSEIIDPMLSWALNANPTRLVDPGCGSGRYTAAALRANPDLEVVAIDLDPLATLLTRAMLAVMGAKSALVLCDSYLTAPIPAHDGVTAWVGNPPYVRHHDLPPEVKVWATETAKGLGQSISGLAGLHALFFLATVVHGKAGDVGSFVTSAEWIDVGYGSIVRKLFVDGMGGRALDLVDPKAVPFHDAMTTSLITCFEIGYEPKRVAVHLVDTPQELANLEGGKMIAATELAARKRWSPLFREARAAHTGQLLGDIVRVHRGFVTGANAFFLMTKDQAKARGLSAWVKPAITAASEILNSGGVIRDAPQRKVLLDLPADFDNSAHPDVNAYLATGEAAGVDQTYICSHRKPWFRVAPNAPAGIVASYMARQAPLFALNPDGLVLLNIGHGLYPKEPMTKKQLGELAKLLNSGRAGFTGAGRTYHGGLEKFEPREMEALPVPEHV